MNEDRTISVINDGEEIGQVITYPETRRHVKEVKYLNVDGTTDFLKNTRMMDNYIAIFFL